MAGVSAAGRAVRNAGSLEEAVHTASDTSACGSRPLLPCIISSFTHELGARQWLVPHACVGAALVPLRLMGRSPSISEPPFRRSLYRLTVSRSVAGSSTLHGKTQTVSNCGDVEFSTVRLRTE